MKHHKYGGSTAERTMNCPAWINLAEGIPKGKASTPALEGTAMHTLFEKGVVDEGYDPDVDIGTVQKDPEGNVTITQVHADKVVDALEVLDKVIEKYDMDVDAEASMEYDADTGGTADIIGFNPEDNVFAVGDLKTGDGLMVYAEENAQLLFYTWLAVMEYRHEFEFNSETVFLLFIIQPSERRDDPLDVWQTDLATIVAFGEAFKLAVRVSNSGHKDPNPGKWCKYCPALFTCPAKTGLVAAASRLRHDSGELDDLIKAMTMVDDVEEWCRAVRKMAHEQAEQGVKLPGYKIVNKRATRIWTNPAETEKTLKLARKITIADYMEMTLMSPAKLEKVLKRKKVDFKKYESMITLHSSGTTLVKADDKRQEALPLDRIAGMVASIN